MIIVQNKLILNIALDDIETVYFSQEQFPILKMEDSGYILIKSSNHEIINFLAPKLQTTATD